MKTNRKTKGLTIVLPAYNEQNAIEKCLQSSLYFSRQKNFPVEILICENGSTDETWALAKSYSELHPSIRLLRLDQPNYGAAIRYGIEKARYDTVALMNIDFYDFAFVEKARNLLLQGADIVVGSKLKQKGWDQRPRFRRLLSRYYNRGLRWLFRFEGTDTHGLKLLSKNRCLEIVAHCITAKEVFDTELILRAGYAGLKIEELPVRIVETRETRYSVFSRTWPVIRDLSRLWFSLFLGIKIKKISTVANNLQ